MHSDANKHFHHFDGLGLTDEQKSEYVQLIRNLCFFVIEEKLKLHPVHLARRPANDDVKQQGVTADPLRVQIGPTFMASASGSSK